MKKKIAICQSNYIPWKGYFDMINMVDTFVLYDDVQYTKNDWRNRNLIQTKNGLNWITIPVKQKKLDQLINETEIAQKNWNVKHWKTLEAVYGRAPFFNNYKKEFKELYESCNTSLLSEINKKFICKINEILGISTKIISSKSLELTGDKNERLIDACKKLDANVYLSGPAAKSYIDISLFKNEEIDVEWMEYSGYKEYKQSFFPFEHGVSILDVLFNLGPESIAYLKSF